MKPCPDLSLSYFVERDVFGDDPETAEIEPSIPAEFSLLINNVGYGDANSVKIATGQPEIVDNQKGLAIHFEMIGSSMNGKRPLLISPIWTSVRYRPVSRHMPSGISPLPYWDISPSTTPL